MSGMPSCSAPRGAADGYLARALELSDTLAERDPANADWKTYRARIATLFTVGGCR